MFRPMVGGSFIDSPNWPTLGLVTILVLGHVQKSVGGFTVVSILTRIPLAMVSTGWRVTSARNWRALARDRPAGEIAIATLTQRRLTGINDARLKCA
jgi:hypothetical protein